jgi:hypothetical protein
MRIGLVVIVIALSLGLIGSAFALAAGATGSRATLKMPQLGCPPRL